MARAVLALMIGVLGVSCTGDRTPPDQQEESANAQRCDQRPGVVPDGFILRRTRDIRQGDEVAVREEYRDADGRLLVYLLGVTGEVGEGLPVADELVLVSGEPADLLGEDRNWVLRWTSQPPCRQMSIVGNGFQEEEFAALLREAQVVES